MRATACFVVGWGNYPTSCVRRRYSSERATRRPGRRAAAVAIIVGELEVWRLVEDDNRHEAKRLFGRVWLRLVSALALTVFPPTFYPAV